MPQQALRVRERCAGDALEMHWRCFCRRAIDNDLPQALNVEIAEEAGEIVPDEQEDGREDPGEAAAFPDGARWGGGGSESGAWHTQVSTI